MNDLLPLLQLLSDGKFHSGEDLARSAGITRAAVWKRLKRLQVETALPLDSVPGRGYRVRHAFDLLSAAAIDRQLSAEARDRLEQLHLLLTTGSTNEYLGRQPVGAIGQAAACLVEHQTAGRGRRGRVWVSPFGQSLYLSLSYCFDLSLAALASMGLVAGVVVAEVLAANGVSEHRLKWPNDLLARGGKLAGILIEASGEANGPARAIIGVGLNVGLDPVAARAIDQPWIDLVQLGIKRPDRNRLAAQIISALLEACVEYQRRGLAPFLERWRPFDACSGRAVAVTAGERVTEGRYLGIAADGALLVDTGVGVRRFLAGEVSLRAGCHG